MHHGKERCLTSSKGLASARAGGGAMRTNTSNCKKRAPWWFLQSAFHLKIDPSNIFGTILAIAIEIIGALQ